MTDNLIDLNDLPTNGLWVAHGVTAGKFAKAASRLPAGKCRVIAFEAVPENARIEAALIARRSGLKSPPRCVYTYYDKERKLGMALFHWY
jgi:hypothetical protein